VDGALRRKSAIPVGERDRAHSRVTLLDWNSSGFSFFPTHDDQRGCYGWVVSRRSATPVVRGSGRTRRRQCFGFSRLFDRSPRPRVLRTDDFALQLRMTREVRLYPAGCLSWICRIVLRGPPTVSAITTPRGCPCRCHRGVVGPGIPLRGVRSSP
jgi:hypothetical protein